MKQHDSFAHYAARRREIESPEMRQIWLGIFIVAGVLMWTQALSHPTQPQAKASSAVAVVRR